jgi:hypothetical protein
MYSIYALGEHGMVRVLPHTSDEDSVDLDFKQALVDGFLVFKVYTNYKEEEDESI